MKRLTIPPHIVPIPGVLAFCVSVLTLACQPPAEPQVPVAVEAAAAAPAAEAPSVEATPAEPEFGPSPWWDAPYPAPFDSKLLKEKPSLISVKRNYFVDETGEKRVFQGVSIADPDKLRREGQWSRRLFAEVSAWGANVVRIPVHPAAWKGVGPSEYFKLLDQAVIWANETGLYIIIDWHSIGNLRTEMFQHPMYNTTLRETAEFWRAISFRYKGITTVAFYEIFNEPTVYNGNLGAMTWKEWKAINEELIEIIYSHDDKVIPLVAGFNWAYELGPVKWQPIKAKGIAYVSHPYPMKTKAPYEKNWDKTFGFVAKRYPLFATEIGYMRAGLPGAHDPVIDDGTYGPRMTEYLAKKGASWVAWVFHPHWSPQLISDWEFAPTESGAHFQKVMLERQAKEEPPPPPPPPPPPAVEPVAAKAAAPAPAKTAAPGPAKAAVAIKKKAAASPPVAPKSKPAAAAKPVVAAKPKVKVATPVKAKPAAAAAKPKTKPAVAAKPKTKPAAAAKPKAKTKPAAVAKPKTKPAASSKPKLKAK